MGLKFFREDITGSGKGLERTRGGGEGEVKRVSKTIVLGVTISPRMDEYRKNTAVDSQCEKRNILTEVLYETENRIAGGKEHQIFMMCLRMKTDILVLIFHVFP